MLDKQIFESLLAELATYYKRPVTPFVQELWYSYLSDRLSTEQFTQAVSRWLLTVKSMPSALALVESCRTDDVTANSLSLTEWDLCVMAAPRPLRIGMISGLSPQGQFALRLVGGLDKLGMAGEDQLALMKRQFLSVWEVMKADVQVIPKLEDPETPVCLHVPDGGGSLLGISVGLRDE